MRLCFKFLRIVELIIESMTLLSIKRKGMVQQLVGTAFYLERQPVLYSSRFSTVQPLLYQNWKRQHSMGVKSEEFFYWPIAEKPAIQYPGRKPIRRKIRDRRYWIHQTILKVECLLWNLRCFQLVTGFHVFSTDWNRGRYTFVSWEKLRIRCIQTSIFLNNYINCLGESLMIEVIDLQFFRLSLRDIRVYLR